MTEVGQLVNAGWLDRALVRNGNKPEAIPPGRASGSTAFPAAQVKARWKRIGVLAESFAYLE